MIQENEIMKFNCTKCKENNNLKYYEDINSFICTNTFYVEKEKECVIKYCRICEKDNNYFYKICLPSNYEVNPLTGGCVRKTDKVPAIEFKDIFRLELNKQKLIGGRILSGPFLSFRGLTNSQISTNHTFLVYLTFILQANNTYRNLEEEIKVPTYCQIVESVDETDDEPNIVDYDCIGNLRENYNLSEYKLKKIEESLSENEKLLGNSNLDELASETDLENIDKKSKTKYDLKSFFKLTTFSLDEIKPITSPDYHFDFTLKGKLNRELEVGTIDAQIPLSQNKDKKVECKFNIKENKEADLSCDINLEEYKDYNKFSFKITEIGSNENPIYLSRINEINLISENKTKKNYTIIIIVCVIVGVIIISIIIGIIIFKMKKVKSNIIDDKKIKQKCLKNIHYSNIDSKRNIITNKK